MVFHRLILTLLCGMPIRSLHRALNNTKCQISRKLRKAVRHNMGGDWFPATKLTKCTERMRRRLEQQLNEPECRTMSAFVQLILIKICQ